MPADPTRLDLTDLAVAYRAGDLTPMEATEAYLERIEPGPIYRSVTAARARAQAQRAGRAFEAGVDLGPLQGIPIAVKDLIDMEGEISAAGSALLRDEAAPARADAPLLARLDEVGAVFLGKTHMTEFAFSGVGLNPHFGTPGNAADPSRVPGGSSSGSAVAVATGRACAAIGSDTGGSVRIPAAFNGLVGLKTTDGDVPTEGTVPLSTTLDTLGPIARTLEDAHALWRAMRGRPGAPLPDVHAPLRLIAPSTVLQDGLDTDVRAAFDVAVDALAAAGHVVERREIPALAELDDLYGRYGSFAAHEALALYEERLERAGDRVDARVAARILAGRGRPATDYLRLTYARRRLVRSFWDDVGDADALLAPTVAVLPPPIDELAADDDAFFRANAAILRNTAIFNLLSGPALTLPVGRSAGGLPIGGTVATAPGREAHAFAVGARWRAALA